MQILGLPHPDQDAQEQHGDNQIGTDQQLHKEEQQDPREIDDNGQQEDQYEGEAMEMQILGLPHPDQDAQAQHGDNQIVIDQQLHKEDQQGAEKLEMQQIPPQEQEESHEGDEDVVEENE